MQLITRQIAQALDDNWNDQKGLRPPAMKLFNPTGAATWLIHSRDPDDPDRLFGLCDLGQGCPELGYASLSEIEALQVPLRIRVGNFILAGTTKIERDLHFSPVHSLQAYALAAEDNGTITESRQHLEAARIALAHEG